MEWIDVWEDSAERGEWMLETECSEEAEEEVLVVDPGMLAAMSESRLGLST